MISVLCVDDDSAYLSLEKRFLEEPGVLTVTTALSAPEALKEMETNRFDAVVADYQMPGMDGIELLRAVRAANPSLPFILYTGRGREELVIEAFNSGADFYLQKNGEPTVQFAQLKDTILRAVKLGAVWDGFHDSETRYRRLFETAQDGILILDAESGVITDANPSLLTLLGYARDEILGKKLWEIGFIRDKALAEQASANLKMTGYIRYEDLPLATKDGRAIDVEFVGNAYVVDTQKVIQCNIRDITGRRKAEETLRISEEKYRKAFFTSPDSICITRLNDGMFVSANKGFEDITGYTEEDIAGKTSLEINIWKDPDDRRKIVEGLQANGEVRNYEARFLTKSKEICGLMSASIIELNGVPHILNITRDITDRKRADEDLRQSEDRYREFFTISRDSVFITSPEGGWIDFNDALVEMLGYESREEISEVPVPSIYANPEERSAFLRLIERDGYVREYPVRLKQKDGTVIDTLITTVPVRNPDGSLKAFIGTIRNITESKRAEKALVESEDRYRAIYDQSPIAIELYDVAGTLVHVNPACLNLFGVGEIQEIQNFSLFADPNINDEQKEKLRQGESVHYQGPFDFEKVKTLNLYPTSRDGILWLDVLITPLGNRSDSITGFLVQVQDITDRKRAEVTLNESEGKYRTLVETTGTGFVILGDQGQVLDANLEYVRLTGHTSLEEIAGRNVNEWTAAYDKDRNEEAVGQCMRDGYIRNLEIDYVNTSGTIIPIEINATVLRSGDAVQILTLCRDITGRKLTEETLCESEERLRAIFETAKDSIFIKDISLCYIHANPAMASLFNMRVEEILGKTDGDLFGSDAAPHIDEVDRHVLSGETVEEYPSKLVQGVMRNFHTIKVPLHDKNGKIVGLCGIARDITDRTRAEVALHDSERFLDSIVEQIPAMIFVKDARDLRFVRFNKAGEDLLGYSRAEMLGKNDYDFFPKNEADFFTGNDREVLNTNRLTDIPEEKIQTRYKGERILHTRKIPIVDEKGDPRYLLGISEDITERKLGNDALRETKNYLENLIQYANVPIVSWNPELKITEFNRAFGQLNGMTRDGVIGQSLAILFPEEIREKTMDLIRRALSGEYWDVVEIPVRHVSGETRIVLWNSSNILDPTGTVMATIAQGQDITERKAAEEALNTFGEDLERKVTERTSDLSDVNLKLMTEIEIRLDSEKYLTKTVGEKDVLLREVHHRVKNNLQIIISLLNLQSRYMTDETTLSAFRESQNRIKAMALVHEKLYQSTDISKIDLNNYIRFLGNGLFQFFGMTGKGITLTMDIRDISLAIDTAIPVGLMINELISNSLKYAFPDGRKGDISLAIHRQDHTLTILFKDNGSGIPQDLDWKNAKSLGLRLVVSLVEQLSGTIELDRTAGTAFTIVIKEKE